MLRAVLETSVYVSSLLKKQGVPAQVIDAWRALRFQVVTSPAIVGEVARTMSYSRIRRRYPLTDEDIQDFLEVLHTHATMLSGTMDVGDAGIRDPNDEIILACAVEGEVDRIVSSDQDLLVLGDYRGIPIVTPRQFLEELRLSA